MWETLCATVLGLALGYAAVKRLPARLPQRSLVLATGAGTGLLGGTVARVVLGPGHAPATLVLAGLVSLALLSLLWDRDVRATALPTNVPGSSRA